MLTFSVLLVASNYCKSPVTPTDLLCYVCSYDSECKMAKDSKDSEVQQDTLANEVRTLDLKMKALLCTHLAQEKELRAKR